MANIIAIPGLATKTDNEFRLALWRMAERNGWDVDAIATIISIESGFDPTARSPLPGQTATGLIQFTDATAKGLGVIDGADGVRRMTAVEQLALVERYYQRSFGTRVPRPVDYYLAGWGSGIGRPNSHILASLTDEKKFNGGKDNLYTLNSGLDANKDGTITVGDIAAKMATRAAQAKGQRVEIDVPLVPTPYLAFRGSSSSEPSERLDSSFGGLSKHLTAAELPVLTVGSKGDAVRLFFKTVASNDSLEYTEPLRHFVRSFQVANKVRPDGIIGPITWGKFIETFGPLTTTTLRPPAV